MSDLPKEVVLTGEYTCPKCEEKIKIMSSILVAGAANQPPPGGPGDPPDTIAPVITVLGDNPLYLDEGQAFVDPGATALDETDGDITGDIVVSGDTVDVNTPGEYTIAYNVEDAATNPAMQKTRMVVIVAAADPWNIAGLAANWDFSDPATLFDATSGGSLPAGDAGIARIETSSGPARTATQSTSGARPIRKIAAFNGLDCAQFDGVDDWLALAIALNSRTDWTIFAVMSRASAGDILASLGLSNADDGYGPLQWSDGRTYFSTGAQYGYYQDNGLTGPVVLAVTHTAGVFRVWEQGSEKTVNQDANNVGSTFDAIGRTNQAFSKGLIAHILHYTRAFSTGEVNSHNSALITKWFPPVVATKVATVLSPPDFVAGNTTPMEVQCQSAANVLDAADNTTQITFAPSASGFISSIVVGSGSAPGAPGAPVVVTVANGVARVRIGNASQQTFTVGITNNGGLTNPPAESITSTAPGDGVNISAGALDANASLAFQAAIDEASNGDVLIFPPGDWTLGIEVTTNGKHLTIRGAGAGGPFADSSEYVTIGTGTKVLTIQTGLTITPGETLRLQHTAGPDNWMQGAVTSYSGSTLTMSISSTSGSGTWRGWTVMRPDNPAIHTILRMPRGGTPSQNEIGFAVIESQSGSTVIENIHWSWSAGVNNFSDIVKIYDTGGSPVKVRDCWFSTNGGMSHMIDFDPNRGIIYNCRFDAGFRTESWNDDQAIGRKNDGAGYSWTTASTMGTADTTGLNNMYIEDNYFVGIPGQCTDFDDNSRTVFRYNRLNQSGITSHGKDTSAFGCRHFEIYNNTFVWTPFEGSGGAPWTYNINRWLYLRGGTGVFTDNVIPNLISTAYGDKAEISFTVQSLNRNAGPFVCWTGGWPVPHQVGQGFVGGSEGLEPVYVWNNTGGGNQNPIPAAYTPNECPSPPPIGDYLQAGRDWIMGAKPGYTKYTYPHPLRSV